MRLTRPIFWAEFSLVMMTASIIYWYIFASSNNGCQMTFMMEPPKFISVHIDDDIKFYQQQSKLYSKSELSKYKLFMYSELGFPSQIDISRDLKDSMPVLFIPGNAGSYQQVRSLASTSIKSQLTSLKALKFIFYTIDFRGQLSGLSGELIEDQIQFVQQSLKQISRIHSQNFDGVIIVGHSVGGLIAKALFAVPNFDTKSVPLIINLASPLNKPFLNFDSKMQAIYDRTRDFWSQKPIDFSTVSISISGGRPDRLVPMHITMDTEYDFSLTTGSINGVWLETDHVSITWCKELMHKIAALLSALMDKAQTRIIRDRYSTIAIVEKELLTRNDKAFSLDQTSILSPLETLTEPITMIELKDSISIARTELSNNIIILNFTQTDPQDFIVVIEHIEPLKGKEIYGCTRIEKQPESNQLQCVEKKNILKLSKSIPSRRQEPKRTAVKVTLRSNYLILDFKFDKNRAHKLPESIAVQSFGNDDNTQIRLPDINEILLSKIIPSSDSYLLPVVEKSFSYNQFKVTNLNALNRFTTMYLRLEQCPEDDSDPKLGVALLYKNGYLNRAFHLNPAPVTKRGPRIAIKFSTDQLSITTSTENDVTLELFTNGRCANKIWFEFDYWDLIFDFIQVHLDKLIQVSCLLVTIMLYIQTRAIVCGHEMSWKDLSLELIGSLMFVALLRFHSSEQLILVIRSFPDNFHDLTLIIVFSLTALICSCGIVATLKHLLNCTIDLAIIVNRVQVNTRKVLPQPSSGTEGSNHQNGINNRNNSNHTHTSARDSQTLSFDWVIIGLASGLSVVFSHVFMDICCIFLLIKFAVLINTSKEAIYQREEFKGNDDSKDTPPEIQILRYERVHNWSISLSMICTISLISNIPSILLRLNRMNSNGYNGYDIIMDFPSVSGFVYAIASLVMIKLSYQKILSDYLDTTPIEHKHLGDWRHGFYRMIIKIFTLWHALNISDCFSVSANLLLLFAATSSYQYLTQPSRFQENIEKNSR